tara:strand:+ start:7180 stop:7806 length:627 start_codon:yes stop_codon:yes gene_type:complete
MTIEHKDIVDGERHEPKGASTATLDYILKSDGDGSTSFVDPASIIDVGALTSTLLLAGFSTAGEQEPAGLDVAMNVEFGAAFGSPASPVEMNSAGLVTFNQAGSYTVRVIFQYGRTGSQSQANLHARLLLNGAQLGNSVSASVDTAGILIASSITSTINASIGDTVSYQLVRDSSGADQGGLFASVVSAVGWNFSPSASIVIERLQAS